MTRLDRAYFVYIYDRYYVQQLHSTCVIYKYLAKIDSHST